ncbi:MAG: hypothetical protein ACTSXA_03185 [Candidatus Heimdallarchaeota archaeon]
MHDLDNDGVNEVIIGSDDKSLYCLDENGQLLLKCDTNGEIRFASAIVDIDDDSKVEIIFGSLNEGIYCLSLTDVVQSGEGQWYSFRGSRFNTGWKDSDSDYIDDLTEVTYYDTDPHTPNLNFIPPTNNPSLLFSNIGVLVIIPVFAFTSILEIVRRKRKRF